MALISEVWKRELAELELELRCAEAALREGECRNRPDQESRSRVKIAMLHAKINSLRNAAKGRTHPGSENAIR